MDYNQQARIAAQSLQPMGQLAGTQVASQFKQTAVPTPVVTLARVVALSEELNKRLGSLSSSVEEIARTIGGPFPRSANASIDRPPANSVIAGLGDQIERAHGWVTDLENAVKAIHASLGA